MGEVLPLLVNIIKFFVPYSYLPQRYIFCYIYHLHHPTKSEFVVSFPFFTIHKQYDSKFLTYTIHMLYLH